MSEQRINRVSRVVVIVLSLTALLTVLSGYLQPHQFGQADEGTGAHIFQLSIAAVVPMLFVFVATADWTRPARGARVLASTAVILALAFAALSYGEHYFR